MAEGKVVTREEIWCYYGNTPYSRTTVPNSNPSSPEGYWRIGFTDPIANINLIRLCSPLIYKASRMSMWNEMYCHEMKHTDAIKRNDIWWWNQTIWNTYRWWNKKYDTHIWWNKTIWTINIGWNQPKRNMLWNQTKLNVLWKQVVQTLVQEGMAIPPVPEEAVLPLVEFPLRALVFHAQVLFTAYCVAHVSPAVPKFTWIPDGHMLCMHCTARQYSTSQ